METADKGTGMMTRRKIEKLERDRVRLITPDTAEKTRDLGNGRVMVTTSQIQYHRRASAAPFDYNGVLMLARLETHDSRHSDPRAQVQDGQGYYGWVNNLNDLEDVQ
jgi:hypothetical protein